jgi:hypothetical protein
MSAKIGRRLVSGRRLRAWLAPSPEDFISDSDLRLVLGIDPEAISPSDRESMLFALALLRDVYADDRDVERWLLQPRPEFGGATAANLLRGGEVHVIETLLVREWNNANRRDVRRRTPGTRTHPNKVG